MNVPNRYRRNFVSRVYLAPMGRRHLCMEGEPGAGGGGSGGTPPNNGGTPPNNGGTPPNNGGTPPNDPLGALPAEQRTAIEALFGSRIANETQGLKNKNNELIGELRTLKESLKSYDGIDPEAVKAILKRFGDDEEAQLIKEGKIDEVLSRRTERLQQAHGRELKQRDDALAKEKQKSAKLAQRAVADAIKSAAIKAGALPEAMEDIVLRAQGAGWTVNDDGEVVAAKDGEIIIGKDGKTPLTLSEWAEELRNAAPHLWPRAQGSGAPGSGASGRAGTIPSNLSPEARLTLAREQAAMRH